MNFPPRRVERGGSAVEEAARTYRELKKSGKPIGMRDIMIGGITIANNLSFSTNNTKDFKRIKNLKLFTL
ncbi:MAG TPA: type II toxin-antitoxin system VapC family toxin [Bacteroidetes bacterium]|nr:type II toxin-antitoxin system VapC family toxin [Bacteroidota bacterium]